MILINLGHAALSTVQFYNCPLTPQMQMVAGFSGKIHTQVSVPPPANQFQERPVQLASHVSRAPTAVQPSSFLSPCLQWQDLGLSCLLDTPFPLPSPPGAVGGHSELKADVAFWGSECLRASPVCGSLLSQALQSTSALDRGCVLWPQPDAPERGPPRPALPGTWGHAWCRWASPMGLEGVALAPPLWACLISWPGPFYRLSQ